MDSLFTFTFHGQISLQWPVSDDLRRETDTMNESQN
jgi:hypothetical protein